MGLPILGLLIGIALIWAGDAVFRKKVYLTLLPLPIIALTFSIVIEMNRAESETYLIPEDFRGVFQIHLDSPCASAPTFENGRRLYVIPADGILHTSFGDNFGVQDKRYYLVDANGNRTELTKFNWSNLEDEKRSWRWLFSNPPNETSVGVHHSYTNFHLTNSAIVADFTYMRTHGHSQLLDQSSKKYDIAKLQRKECEAK